MILPNRHKLTGRLFSTPMALANVERRKTETRRMLESSSPEMFTVMMNLNAGIKVEYQKEQLLTCYSPWGKPGDWFYQKETFAVRDCDTSTGRIRVEFAASPDEKVYLCPRKSMLITLKHLGERAKYQPSIHMPFEAARFFGLIEEIRVERLQDITDAGAIAEGIERCVMERANRFIYRDYQQKNKIYCYTNPIDSYESLFKNINGSGSWERNDWVFVIKYKAHTREEFEAAVGTTVEKLSEQIKRKGGKA
jgi:hypothetical protein